MNEAKILSNNQKIAVVGLSRDPNKDSYRVTDFLISKGFKVLGVNPFADEDRGIKIYKSLLDIPLEERSDIDIVDIFRPSNEIPLIVDQAIKIRNEVSKPEVIWMQEGIFHNDAAKRARVAGMTVVMDRCIMKEYIQIQNLPSINKIRDNLNPVLETLEEHGYRNEIHSSMQGASGVNHVFDVIARKNDQIICIDWRTFKKECSAEAVISFFSKKVDIKNNANHNLEFYTIVQPFLSREAKNLASMYKLNIIESSVKQQAVKSLRNMMSKKLIK